MAGRSYKKLMESLKTTRKPLDLEDINTLFLEDHEGMDPLEEDQLDEELMVEEMSPSPALPLSIWPPQLQTMHTPRPPNTAVHIVAMHRIAGHQTGLHPLTIHLLAIHSLATHLPTLLPPRLMLLRNQPQSTLSMKSDAAPDFFTYEDTETAPFQT
ncbi:UNVERIFIED_CONTAM: hypothetical protein FKN15_050718 [Acipenser sinensis]